MRSKLFWGSGLLLSLAMLGGCIVSEQPLLSTSAYPSRTFVKPGWYLRQDVVTNRQGEKVWEHDVQPVLIKLNGRTYSYHTEPNKVERSFEIFGPVSGETGFVAQALLGKGIWGYQAIHQTGDESFATIEARCNEMIPSQRSIAHERGWLAQPREGSCMISDVNPLVTILFSSAWERPKLEVFQQTRTDSVVKPSQLQPPVRTLNDCSGEFPQQSHHAAFGIAAATPTGLRRHVVAATKTGYALAVEAQGNTIGRWAFWGQATPSNMRVHCKASRMIQVKEWVPAKLNDYTTADPAETRETCRFRNWGNCGTLREMVAKSPGDVLVQGEEYFTYPDGSVSKGGLLTILGQEGVSPTLTVLRTVSNGTTHVLEQR